MRERDLLKHIYDRSSDLSGAAPVLVGPGDDCAVIEVGGKPLLLTVDQLVERRHFDPETTPLDLIARKAVGRSISDIAAMGGRPLCGLATACLPQGYEHATELFDAMAGWARHWSCPLVGGDISGSDGALMLTVTALGEPHGRRGPVLRSQARVGDSVFATGRFGGSVGSEGHLTFEPRVREADALCDVLGDQLGGMIDVSDGLGLDGSRVAEASGVRIEIDAVRVPRHEGVSDWGAAVGDGEDYELLFTTRGSDALRGSAPFREPELTLIGRVVEGHGCVVIDEQGREHDASDLGWDHGV